MDIYELRRKTNVYSFGHHDNGVSIFYEVGERHCSICIDHATLSKELIMLGSWDDNLTIDEKMNYCISQWDALNIAIRFELARAQEKELDNSDIFKAIANVIKPSHGQGDAY